MTSVWEVQVCNTAEMLAVFEKVLMYFPGIQFSFRELRFSQQ
jgi:hypothetical protein